MTYQDINKKTIDKWVDEGWIWGIPIDHDTYVKATKGDWTRSQELVSSPQRKTRTRARFGWWPANADICRPRCDLYRFG